MKQRINIKVGILLVLVITLFFGAAISKDLVSAVSAQSGVTAIMLDVDGISAENKVYDRSYTATVDFTLAKLTGFVEGQDVQLNTDGAYGEFLNRNVGQHTVRIYGLTLEGANAGNYMLNPLITTLAVITPKPLVGVFDVDNKPYDGTTDTTGIVYEPLQGILPGDTVYWGPPTTYFYPSTAGTATFGSKDAGFNKDVILTGATLGGISRANYVLEPIIAKADIYPIVVPMAGDAFIANDKFYDGTDAATVQEYLPLGLAGDDVRLSGGTATFDDKNEGTGKTVTLIGAELDGFDAPNYTLADPNEYTALADIYKAILTATFTVDNKEYDGTRDATGISITLTGVIGEEDVELNVRDARFDNKNQGIGKDVELRLKSANNLKGDDKSNYTLETPIPNAKANIYRKPVTGFFEAVSRYYNGRINADVVSGSEGVRDIVTGEDVGLSYSKAQFDTKDVGVGKFVFLRNEKLVGADADNYELVEMENARADIWALKLTVDSASFKSDPKIYDGNTNVVVEVIDPELATTLVGTIVAGEDVQIDVSGPLFGITPSANVGLYPNVEVRGLLLFGADSANYVIDPLPQVNASILAIHLMGGFTAENKQYDGNRDAVVSPVPYTLPGVLPGDDVTLSAGTYAEFDTAAVGDNKLVVLNGVVLQGLDSGNYILDSVTARANITKRLLGVLSFTADNKTYDGTVAATVTSKIFAVGGIVGSDVVELTAEFEDKNVGNGKLVSLTTILGGAQGGNYELDLPLPTTTANITKKTITGEFTAENKQYDGTRAATVIDRLLLDTIPGDDVTLVGGVAQFENKQVGDDKSVELRFYTLEGEDKDNYNIASSLFTVADITPRELTVSGITADKFYDGTNAAVLDTTNALLANIVEIGGVFEDVYLDPAADGAPGTFADAMVENDKVVTPNAVLELKGSARSHYILIQPTILANISPKPITAIFTVADKVYDGTVFATVTARLGFVAGDVVGTEDVNWTDGAPLFEDKNAGLNKPVFLTGAILTGADKANYTLIPPTTTADIYVKDITGSFSAANKQYDGDNYATVIEYYLPEAVDGDDVSLTSLAALFDNEEIGNNKPVSLVSAKLVGVDAPNYNLLSVTDASADITPKELTVNGITAADKVYDGNTDAVLDTSAAVLDVAGVLAGDLVSLDATAAVGTFADANVADGIEVLVSGLALSGADSDKYTIIEPITTANIEPKHIMGAFTANDKDYDGTEAAEVLTYSLTGVIGLDDVELSGNAEFDTKDVGLDKPVSLKDPILTGADAANYILDLPVADASADITAKELTVSGITAADKTYDGNTDAVLDTSAAVLDGVVPGDLVDLDLTGAVGTFADANVGNWMVMISGLALSGADSGNYALIQPSTMANILPEPVVYSLYLPLMFK